jgi:glucose-1-phosphatase
VVVLSRHNIRAPLSGGDSSLGKMTPHEWYAWSSNPSELSLRGGVLETEMGQYFCKWLEQEELFPENFHPEPGQVRIYANSKQRTIATAKYFTAGLLPTAKTEVESHVEFDEMDPVFHPQLTFVSPSYVAAAEEQVWSLYAEAVSGLEDNYKLISQVIDLEKSPAWQDGSATELKTDDTELTLELNAEPNMSGSLKTACSISDALVLQYYEEADEEQAAFGHHLTREEWTAISEIKDVYGDVLFTAPLVAANVAHPLLQEIQAEFKTPGRAFTFLCGHDSNVGSVLAALGAEDYELPDAIEQTTPIGCKLVFTRWKDADGGAYYGLDLVYQTCEQLRTQPLLGLENPPAMVPLSLSGLSANEDGLYSEGDFLGRLSQAITEYDRIVKTYSDSIADAA